MGAERLDALQERLDRFYHERDWRRFQTLKDVAASAAVEVGELQQLFLWSADEQAVLEAREADVAREVADVLINLLNFAHLARIDLVDACGRKLDELEQRYPVSAVRSRVIGKGG